MTNETNDNVVFLSLSQWLKMKFLKCAKRCLAGIKLLAGQHLFKVSTSFTELDIFLTAIKSSLWFEQQKLNYTCIMQSGEALIAAVPSKISIINISVHTVSQEIQWARAVLNFNLCYLQCYEMLFPASENSNYWSMTEQPAHKVFDS